MNYIFLLPIIILLATSNSAIAQSQKAYSQVYKKFKYFENGQSVTASLELDLIYDPSKKRPLLIFIHGGGWLKGDKKFSNSWMADFFFTRGFAFATVNYRICPESNCPKKNRNNKGHLIKGDDGIFSSGNPTNVRTKAKEFQVYLQAEDVIDSINWLKIKKDLYNIDTSRIILMGHSAGGHLASLAYFRGLAQSKLSPNGIRGIISLDTPVFDNHHFRSPVPGPNRGNFKNVFGFKRNPTWNATSVLFWMSRYYSSYPTQRPPQFLAIYRAKENANHTEHILYKWNFEFFGDGLGLPIFDTQIEHNDYFYAFKEDSVNYQSTIEIRRGVLNFLRKIKNN